MQIAFTGARKLNQAQQQQVYGELTLIGNHQADWHVGDAPGLDAIAREMAMKMDKNLTVYEVEGFQKWHFAERSKRMIDALVGLPSSCLYAFPNKPCPEGCKPCKNPNGRGSGTWLTVAYARYQGLQIQIFPLVGLSLPEWLQPPTVEQLKLF